LVSGDISVNRGYGTATLSLKVIGEKATVNATVDLVYASGKPWRVTSAAYENEDGKMIDLLNPYESLVSNICRGGPPKKPQRLIWVKACGDVTVVSIGRLQAVACWSNPWPPLRRMTTIKR